jgi:hypothetical protein
VLVAEVKNKRLARIIVYTIAFAVGMPFTVYALFHDEGFARTYPWLVLLFLAIFLSVLPVVLRRPISILFALTRAARSPEGRR